MKKAFNLFTFIVFSSLGMVFFSGTVYAYLDPSVMTYIVQIVAGIVIAAGASVLFYFKRIARKIKKKDDDNGPTEDNFVHDEADLDDDGEFDDSNISAENLNDADDSEK